MHISSSSLIAMLLKVYKMWIDAEELYISSFLLDGKRRNKGTVLLKRRVALWLVPRWECY